MHRSSERLIQQTSFGSRKGHLRWYNSEMPVVAPHLAVARPAPGFKQPTLDVRKKSLKFMKEILLLYLFTAMLNF